jgi:hypothetical protein
LDALIFLAPHRAAAAQIEWFLDPATLVFGLNPAEASGRFPVTFVDRVRYETGSAPFESDISGEVLFTTGPLLDLSVVTDAFGSLRAACITTAPANCRS